MNVSAYDAIVIGAGHNGLVCAAYLARAERRVRVLERAQVLGGCSTTESLLPDHPQFRFNRGAIDLAYCS
jgi:beta-carotene ketolase (CrtO type)